MSATHPFRSLLVTGTSLLLASIGAAQTSGYLNIGDPAPPLTVQKWVKGQPADRLTKGKVYVVEFWATWCGPCKENIPRLTDLAKKYAGQATIAGIDIWERTDAGDTKYADRVAAFVKSQGTRMDYLVGMDDAKATIANAWMKAAGEGGIPMSFVIGRDGHIAWMGHVDGLEAVLPKVLDGTFDVAAARRQRTLQVEVFQPVRSAMEGKEYDKALRLIEAKVAKQPELARYFEYDKYSALAHTDLAKAKEMGEGILKVANGEIGAYQMMGSVYASQSDLSPEAYRYGMGLIEEALVKKDREYLFLSMAGAVSMFQKDKVKALDYAKRAVAAAEKDPHAPAPFIEMLRRNVAKYEGK